MTPKRGVAEALRDDLQIVRNRPVGLLSTCESCACWRMCKSGAVDVKKQYAGTLRAEGSANSLLPVTQRSPRNELIHSAVGACCQADRVPLLKTDQIGGVLVGK